MSETLRRELMLYGIDVIVIGPGSVATAIWDKGEAEDLTVYEKTDYKEILEQSRKYFIAEGRKGLAPERLGEWYIMHSRRRAHALATQLCRNVLGIGRCQDCFPRGQ